MQRDWVANITVLSGDLHQDDTTDPNGVVTDMANIVGGDNAFHVVTGGGTNSSAVLDGFTVTAGQANSTVPNDTGDGMYNDGSSPTLTNVSFSGNQATTLGGGIFNIDSSSTLTNVNFAGNHANDSGVGMFNYLSNLILANVTFAGNQAGYGGGMYNRDNDRWGWRGQHGHRQRRRYLQC